MNHLDTSTEADFAQLRMIALDRGRDQVPWFLREKVVRPVEEAEPKELDPRKGGCP